MLTKILDNLKFRVLFIIKHIPQYSAEDESFNCRLSTDENLILNFFNTHKMTRPYTLTTATFMIASAL